MLVTCSFVLVHVLKLQEVKDCDKGEGMLIETGLGCILKICSLGSLLGRSSALGRSTLKADVSFLDI